jgi:hypothetical protein
MKPILMAMIVISAFALSAHAQVAPEGAGGITETNDPAKAEAVEKAAREIKERAMNQPQSSAEIVRSQTDGGYAFLSGGASTEDRQAMTTERAQYSLWVATVAKPSGAYLANARLRIVNVRDKSVVLERTMDGPWLFAALPAGTYDVSAIFRADGTDKDQALSERVIVGKGGQRQVVLRFASSAQVAPEVASASKGNPFSEAPAPK